MESVLVGDFKKDERERHPRGEPEQVRVHDFRDKTKGKAIPRGIDDILNNQGWVSVGIGHDTAQFAANSIRRWWREMGRRRFPHDSRQGVLAHCLALSDQNPVDARRAIAPRALLVRRLERSRQLRATLRLGANRPDQRRVVAAGRNRQRPAHRLDREPVAMLVNPFESRAEAIQNIA